MQKLIDDAIEKARCLVHISTNPCLFSVYPAYIEISGKDWRINRWDAQPRIYINGCLSLQEQLAFLYHELGHLNCFLKRCKCFPPRIEALAEFHATRFALKHIPNKRVCQWYAKGNNSGKLGTEETRKRVLRCKAYQEVMK